MTRFESRFERFRPEVSGDAWREDARADVGGGLLLDLGPHLVDQARELFGHPVRVYAEMNTRRPGAKVDDDTFVALEHAGGERSHLWMSSVAPLNGPRFRVSGLRAGFASDGLDPQEAQLAEGMRPGDEGYGVGDDGRAQRRPEGAARTRRLRALLPSRARAGCAARAPRPWTRATASRSCACSTPPARALKRIP